MNERDVEGCLVVSQPRHIKQLLTREHVAAELGVGVEVLEQPPERRGVVLARLGVKGSQEKLASLREAAAAAAGRDAPPATPGGLLVRREKTQLGAKRHQCLLRIRQVVAQVLAEEGGIWGTHSIYTAANAANLLLTQGSVREANRGGAAVRYPVEAHLGWRAAGNRGKGGFTMAPAEMQLDPPFVKMVLLTLLGPAQQQQQQPPAAATPAPPHKHSARSLSLLGR
jgi:hypothetical protein